MPKPPTISDIARAANVSPATVSRVLNGSSPVAEAKRAAVLAAIEQLNFRPNLIARHLVRGRSATIGILTQSMASPFFSELAQGVEQELHGTPYHPVFASGRWHVDEEIAAFHLLLDGQVGALIVLGGQLPDQLLREANTHTPVLAVGRTIAGLEQRCIRSENAAGAYSATRHLIELGHRRIAHITGVPDHVDSIERLHGYQQALRDAGIQLDGRLVLEGDFSEQSGLLLVEALLVRGVSFTALLAANDQMALGARLGLYRRGLRVPEDISLIGFDDLPIAAYTAPPLTTVRQPMIDMGRAAARGALQLLAGEPLELPAFTTELVVRETTAWLRGG